MVLDFVVVWYMFDIGEIVIFFWNDKVRWDDRDCVGVKYGI